jgi:hypothetical protein
VRPAPPRTVATGPVSGPVPSPASGELTPRRTRSASASLIDDVEERLVGTLPDETWARPAHGKDMTIGAEGRASRSGAPGLGTEPRRPHGNAAGYSSSNSSTTSSAVPGR